MNNDQSIERQIQAKGLTAPRITPADLNGTRRPDNHQEEV